MTVPHALDEGTTSPPHIDSTSPPPEALRVTPPTVALPASRDPSLSRRRALSATNIRNNSPRGTTPAAQARPKVSLDGGPGAPERKPSQSYGHHRQTSIVHGVQHSRNPSALTAATHTSPLSPHKIISAGLQSDGSYAPNGDLKKSPSMSVLHSQVPSIVRRPERMHSGKVKRNHEHHRSQSRQQHRRQPSDLKTVGEYALHHLFTSFIAEADERINRFMSVTSPQEARIEAICGPGADPSFDQLIASLGHICRDRPKNLIDSAIGWRQGKSNYANSMLDELQGLKDSSHPISGTTRRFANGSSATMNTASTLLKSPRDLERIAMLDASVTHAERSSSVSVYILCRVLIGILSQTTAEALAKPAGSNTAEKLEEVIYGQLTGLDPETLAMDPFRQANWAIRGQLMGVMSSLRFEQVSHRFIKDLEQAHQKLDIKGHSDTKLMGRTALLVQSMRWLKVNSYPEEAWDHTCDTFQLLARFYANVHGRKMKYAYSTLFENLLLSIAGTATSEFNMPKWKEVLSMIQPKLSQMLLKVDHWAHAYPLQAVLICVSPAATFATFWLSIVTQGQPKLRDRASRSHVLKAICRLVWRYLYRSSETTNATAKKLEEVVKMVFAGGKRSIISTDPSVADPLIQLIRIIGFKQQDLCFRTIIFPLMNSELFAQDRDLKIDSLDPEKMVIAIRAFLAIMADLEKGEPPPFPISFECDTLMDPYSRSSATHRRTRSQGLAVSAGRSERLSRPVITSNFGEVAKESYVRFCQILGQITIICDNTFGGQAVLEEKFSSQTPKTPMAEAFAFRTREDVSNPTDMRQNYYDLLHVAVEALPRFLSPHLPMHSLVNLLCTGTAHVQLHIATSSAQSLRSIARQAYAQQVTVGFARFIFNFDDRYATVSDGGLLGPGHIENTLKLYVELLNIWIEDLQKRAKKVAAEPSDDPDAGSRGLPLDLSGVLAQVDEVESHGLFFLCSHSRTVRAAAVTVLKLINKFDTALGRPITRIVSILEGSSQQVIDVNDERLTLAERSRLQKGLRRSNLNSTLVELCSSDAPHDATLWFKVFPSLIRLSAEICPHAAILTRDLVCSRISHAQKTITALAEGPRQNAYAAFESAFAPRVTGRFASSAPETIVEQWKLHVMFACITLTNVGSQQHPVSSQSSQHTRKSSKSSSTSHDRIASATELFSLVVPFLAAANASVRNAAVVGLGATNAGLFSTLLETLQPYMKACNSDAKERLQYHQRSMSSPRRNRRTDHLRTELTHLLSLTAPQLQDPAVKREDWVLDRIIQHAKDLRIFLNDEEVQNQLDFQKLRTYYCALIETIYESVSKGQEPSRWMSFQSRMAAFTLMENWCGFFPNQSQLRQHEESIRRSVLDQQDQQSRTVITASMEKEKDELRNAALCSMAALCAGPVSFSADGKMLMTFDIRRMLAWINAIFEKDSDRTHAIGRKALQNLISHNLGNPHLMAQSMRMCYIAKMPKALSSYFGVVTKVLIDDVNGTTHFWKILCAGLYTLGNEDSQIRMKSARLLRTLEERLGKTSKLQDLDISISDKTPAVYKLAQFEISTRLARHHPELAFHVFSEFSMYFNELQPDHQRNMVAAMLPWIRAIELQVDPNGGPTVASYMLLVNLFEITVKSPITLHNEIQALWQALATGPYGGNVQLVLEFIIEVCLDKREQNFVEYAKQIVVFLSSTPAGLKVIEHLLLHISPKTMIVDRIKPVTQPQEQHNLPYIADLARALPIGNKQSGLSLGQLSMILLVDLIVSPIQLPKDKILTLLQVVLVQWDQYVSIVQDQAREMLVHLIHELVISKIEPGATDPDKKSIEDFIEQVRQQDPKTVWPYGATELQKSDNGELGVHESMAHVTEEVVRIFSVTYPTIRVDLGKTSMDWATSCAVRHIACRSFQVFRCVKTTLDRQMLSSMLARLSNTIADDENHDYLLFSQEILTTLRAIMSALAPYDLLRYPQLFWVTCACLDTIFEGEFEEGLTMLEVFLQKMDLTDPALIKVLLESRPPGWQGGFDGLQDMVQKGVRSSKCMDRSLSIIERLTKLPTSEIVGNDNRLLFAILANLPRYLQSFEDDASSQACLDSAEALADAAEAQGRETLVRALQGFAKSRYRSNKDFLAQTVSAIRTAFFPAMEFQSLVFLLGLINNHTGWFKVNTMQLLCVMIPVIDMNKPEIACQGPDLISPLLRLLQTEYCQQALDVLDNVMTITNTPLDSKHIRMSMAGSYSSRATRKEYDRTKSLYGIPEKSGWSIPMPAIHSARARANVHAVFYTLVNTETNGNDDAKDTPEIEFHNDEHQNDYFTERTTTMMTDDTRADGYMGELAMKLDDLDDFFDEQSDATSSQENGHALRYPSGLVEDREHLYEQQALPILHKSLQRNASVTSFQTGFAELRSRAAPLVMTPGAFNPTSPATLRPGMRGRSITSPQLQKRSPPRLSNDLMSGDEAGDEPEPPSDDDLSIGRTRTADEPYHSNQNTVKPSGFRAGIRQGMKRLTSSSGNAERSKTSASAMQRSPRVPKVPSAWLRDPISAEP